MRDPEGFDTLKDERLTLIGEPDSVASLFEAAICSGSGNQYRHDR
jgi:hypothetical protein